MSAILTVTDNADGTGGVATISGASLGDSAVVKFALWTGDVGSFVLTTAGTISGNGSISIPVSSTGHYYVQATLSPSGITLVYFQNFTNTTATTIHNRILDAVITRINSIGFSWLGPSKVVKRWIPKHHKDLSAEALPMCYVSPIGREVYNDTLMAQDDPGFPVVVALVEASQGVTNPATLERDLDWRIRVSRALRNQRLSGVPEVWNAKIEPDTIVDIGAFLKNYIVSVLAFRFFTREIRGIY